MKLSWPIQVGLILFVLLFLWTLYGVIISMSVSEASYQVLETLENGVEIRAYPEEIWATTVAENQNDAFSPLFRYISGDNERSEKIEMTAPVVTPAPQPAKTKTTKGEKIEMTAPVVTMNNEKGQFMAFIMPERFDIHSIPRPSSSNVKIQLVEPRKLATIRFSGYMTEGNYEKNLDLLSKTLDVRGISTEGEPLLMQYNDPWTPPFSRRNEIALQIINDIAADK
ncbi:MAG: SOUL heme-binding protein [Methanosaeta sp. PtaU1.Bin112]|nr:MAG: SOUL heme-binding protein [Methanosaeta sp. PtaU1.Bin112]